MLGAQLSFPPNGSVTGAPNKIRERCAPGRSTIACDVRRHTRDSGALGREVPGDQPPGTGPVHGESPDHRGSG
ncbi:MAG: hypothetical protein WBP81_18915, partial [Solirubrobacteraceae bacterium]